LIGHNQHDEKQNRGYRAKDKRPELLNDFLHSGPVRPGCSDYPSGQQIFLLRMENFLYLR
jgi:hypothetical protein